MTILLCSVAVQQYFPQGPCVLSSHVVKHVANIHTQCYWYDEGKKVVFNSSTHKIRINILKKKNEEVLVSYAVSAIHIV